MSPRLTQIISELPIVNHDITFSHLVHIGRSDMKFSAVRDSICYIIDIIKDNPELSQMTIRDYLVKVSIRNYTNVHVRRDARNY
jgi:hypothetical protein